MWYCDTDDLPAIPVGKAKMKHIDDETFRLVEELEPKIKAIKESGEITLAVDHGWVSSISLFVKSFRRKIKPID